MIVCILNIMKAADCIPLIFVIGTVKLGFAGADKTTNTTGYLQVSSTSIRHSGFPRMLRTLGSP